MHNHMIRRLGLLGASAAIFAACAGGGSPTTAPVTAAPVIAAPTTAAATVAPATQVASGLTLTLATSPTLGQYVSGANGMALYVFTKDSGTTSACTGGCADNWPPLTVAAASDVTAGAGLLADVGTITRDDGTLQVTLGGHPLYYFKGDAAAGDVNGQGINDVWFVVGPSGTGLGVTSGSATAAPGQSQCSGPTCY